MEIIFRIAAAASFSIASGTHIPQGEIVSTVTFDANGGQGTTTRTITWPNVSIADQGLSFPENPTKEGFTFLGWDATAVFGGEVQIGGRSPILVSPWFSELSPFTHNITVTAEWKSNENNEQ